MQKTKEKTRYSQEELEDFRILIEAKLVKEEENYEVLTSLLTDGNDAENGNADRVDHGAHQGSSDEIAEKLGRSKMNIYGLNDALIRIKQGTFGICSRTGGLISIERLRAIPTATECIEAFGRRR